MRKLRPPKTGEKNEGNTEIVRTRLTPRTGPGKSALAPEPTKIFRVRSKTEQAVRDTITTTAFVATAIIGLFGYPELKRFLEKNDKAAAAPTAIAPEPEVLRQLEPLPPDPNWPPPRNRIPVAEPKPVPKPAQKGQRLATDCFVDYNPDSEDYTFGCDETAKIGVEPAVDLLKRHDFDKELRQVRALVHFTLSGKECISDSDITIALYEDKIFRQVRFTCGEELLE